MDRNETPRSGRGPEAVVSPEALQWARRVISDADEELISDLGAAERHLTLLDETAEPFLFCTFDDVKLPDGKKRGNKKLTKSFYSTLEKCAQELVRRLMQLRRQSGRAWRRGDNAKVQVAEFLGMSLNTVQDNYRRGQELIKGKDRPRRAPGEDLGGGAAVLGRGAAVRGNYQNQFKHLRARHGVSS